MRAKEFINEEINQDVLNPAFNDTQYFDGLTYRATADVEKNGMKFFQIKVFDDNFEKVGIAKFAPYKDAQGNEWLESLITAVHPQYNGKGIARNIYAYVRMLGNNIKPSGDQSDQGRAMWQSWQDSGEAEHLMKEDTAPEILYHVTPARNVKSILAKGLVPSIGQRSAQIETQSNLYFFPSREAAKEFINEAHHSIMKTLTIGKWKVLIDSHAFVSMAARGISPLDLSNIVTYACIFPDIVGTIPIGKGAYFQDVNTMISVYLHRLSETEIRVETVLSPDMNPKPPMFRRPVPINKMALDPKIKQGQELMAKKIQQHGPEGRDIVSKEIETDITPLLNLNRADRRKLNRKLQRKK